MNPSDPRCKVLGLWFDFLRSLVLLLVRVCRVIVDVIRSRSASRLAWATRSHSRTARQSGPANRPRNNARRPPLMWIAHRHGRGRRRGMLVGPIPPPIAWHSGIDSQCDAEPQSQNRSTPCAIPPVARFAHVPFQRSLSCRSPDNLLATVRRPVTSVVTPPELAQTSVQSASIRFPIVPASIHRNGRLHLSTLASVHAHHKTCTGNTATADCAVPAVGDPLHILGRRLFYTAIMSFRP